MLKHIEILEVHIQVLFAGVVVGYIMWDNDTGSWYYDPCDCDKKLDANDLKAISIALEYLSDFDASGFARINFDTIADEYDFLPTYAAVQPKSYGDGRGTDSIIMAESWLFIASNDMEYSSAELMEVAEILKARDAIEFPKGDE